jgi:hypothetical protein
MSFLLGIPRGNPRENSELTKKMEEDWKERTQNGL